MVKFNELHPASQNSIILTVALGIASFCTLGYFGKKDIAASEKITAANEAAKKKADTETLKVEVTGRIPSPATDLIHYAFNVLDDKDHPIKKVTLSVNDLDMKDNSIYYLDHSKSKDKFTNPRFIAPAKNFYDSTISSLNTRLEQLQKIHIDTTNNKHDSSVSKLLNKATNSISHIQKVEAGKQANVTQKTFVK